MTFKKILEDMVQVLAKDVSFYATVKKWAAKFKRVRNSADDVPRSGRRKTSNTDEEINAIHRMVFDDVTV